VDPPGFTLDPLRIDPSPSDDENIFWCAEV
jgi:hypothetical protein